MEKSKMTKKEWFAVLRAMVDASAYEDKQGAYDFIDHEVELLNKKHSNSKPTKTQIENEKLKKVIVEVLTEVGKPVTVSELLTLEQLKGYTCQKISAMLKQMLEENSVVKTVEGKKSLFSV